MTAQSLSSQLFFSGTQINYYYICPRKLWLFSNNLQMEHTSDYIVLGKLLHETSYKRKFKEIEIGNIKLDFLEKNCEVHEIKKSKKIEKAHKYQLLYYLYYLDKLGIKAKGVIDYPLLRKKVKLELTEESKLELETALKDLTQTISKTKPPEPKKKKYCKKCSYYELCWC